MLALEIEALHVVAIEEAPAYLRRSDQHLERFAPAEPRQIFGERAVARMRTLDRAPILDLTAQHHWQVAAGYLVTKACRVEGAKLGNAIGTGGGMVGNAHAAPATRAARCAAQMWSLLTSA